MVDLVVVRRLDLTLDRADDPGRDRAAEAERVADRDDGVADLDEVELPSVRGVSALEGVFTLITAMSVDGSEPTSLALMLVLFEKADLDRLRACDYVVVGDDVAGLVDDEARAESALLLLLSGVPKGLPKKGSLFVESRRCSSR